MAQTGTQTILGTFPAGGTQPTLTINELPYATAAVSWKVCAVNASVTEGGEMVPQTDGNGIVKGFVFGERLKTLEMTAKIQATTVALSVSSFILPTRGAAVVLAGFVEATGNTQFDGEYIIQPGAKLEISDSQTEPAKITFTAIQYSTGASTLLGAIAAS